MPRSNLLLMKAVLLEALLVALLGGALAFAANSVSPLGLKLTGNYFPGRVSAPIVVSTNGAGTNGTTGSGQEQLAARLKEKGLGLIDSKQVAQWMADPRFGLDLIILIDARDDQHYQKGHIPGAYQLDHYHAEKYLPTIFPLCVKADQIGVYCHGGDKCEDSEFAAILLRDAGIPKEKLFIYGGGITEWCANGNQVELGARKSGQFGKCSE